MNINGYDEAKAYLYHPILGERLRRITMALPEHKDLSFNAIFGGIDAIKVSTMTGGSLPENYAKRFVLYA